MAVPGVPFSMSDINTEFGTRTLATQFSTNQGGVGGLPGNMTEFAGTSSLTASLSGTFNTLYDQDILTTYTSTTSITVNISNASTLAVTAGGTGSSVGLQLNGSGPFLSSQTCSDGDTLKARLTTGSSEAATYTCVATMGSYGSKTYTVFTA